VVVKGGQTQSLVRVLVTVRDMQQAKELFSKSYITVWKVLVGRFATVNIKMC